MTHVHHLFSQLNQLTPYSVIVSKNNAEMAKNRTDTKIVVINHVHYQLSQLTPHSVIVSKSNTEMTKNRT